MHRDRNRSPQGPSSRSAAGGPPSPPLRACPMCRNPLRGSVRRISPRWHSEKSRRQAVSGHRHHGHQGRSIRGTPLAKAVRHDQGMRLSLRSAGKSHSPCCAQCGLGTRRRERRPRQYLAVPCISCSSASQAPSCATSCARLRCRSHHAAHPPRLWRQDRRHRTSSSCWRDADGRRIAPCGDLRR